jgi:hypothetical protein
MQMGCRSQQPSSCSVLLESWPCEPHVDLIPPLPADARPRVAACGATLGGPERWHCDARSVLASHPLASAQMLLPDLTQQAEALPRPIAAVSVANAWALGPFLGTFLYFSTVTRRRHRLCFCARSPLNAAVGSCCIRMIYASWIGAVSAGRGDEADSESARAAARAACSATAAFGGL